MTASRALASALLVATLLAGAATGQDAGADDGPRPRNLVFMIADGMGPASLTLARQFQDAPLRLDDILVGSASTHPAGGWVTDSAASATALASGTKAHNGAVGVDPEGQPVPTLLEAAEAAGMATGVVSTTRITHATPACFYAHVRRRDKESDIAEQLVHAGIEVVFGGGARHFLTWSDGGERRDGRDLLREVQRQGYQLVRSRAEFDDELVAPVIGLFSDSHMDYEIDRDPAEQPSLAEMTRAALTMLADDPDGFLLVVEGGRIDHAGHANDPAAHLRDIQAYDEAVGAALDFADLHGDTLVVSTSDHETGGLTLGRDLDGRFLGDCRPQALASVTSSTGVMFDRIESGADLFDVFLEATGIDDLSAGERALLTGAQTDTKGRLRMVLGEVVSRRARLGWATGGHTAVDVTVHASGPGASRFLGHRDNTDIAHELADLFGFDLAASRRDGTR